MSIPESKTREISAPNVHEAFRWVPSVVRKITLYVGERLVDARGVARYFLCDYTSERSKRHIGHEYHTIVIGGPFKRPELHRPKLIIRIQAPSCRETRTGA